MPIRKRGYGSDHLFTHQPPMIQVPTPGSPGTNVAPVEPLSDRQRRTNKRFAIAGAAVIGTLVLGGIAATIAEDDAPPPRPAKSPTELYLDEIEDIGIVSYGGEWRNSVLQWGYTICQDLEDGLTPSAVANQIVYWNRSTGDGSISIWGARAVVEAANDYLCPQF